MKPSPVRTAVRFTAGVAAGLATFGLVAVAAADVDTSTDPASTAAGSGAAGSVATGSGPTGSAGSGPAALRDRGVADTWPVTTCGTYSGTGCAPTADRVDIVKPTFTHPTEITNPLFPISTLRSVVLLGRVDGKPFRSETTLLPRTQTVTWDGKQIEVRLSQYLAYSGGRIEEIALDRYAQADDGSVWYFGEDVFDYVDGQVAITEGTWLAGRDGPPAMIMPAKPAVGDSFRTENLAGVVFEEVKVKAIDQTAPGPRGQVSGVMIGEELHLDGTTSDKLFAPGYGEFYTASEGELEALALAVGADEVQAPMPGALQSLTSSAWGVLENARKDDWLAARTTVDRMAGLWAALQATQPPPRVATRMVAGLEALHTAVKARKAGGTAQAAVDVAQSALDLQLRYRPVALVDVERAHLHAQQLRVFAAAKDRAGVAGEVAVLELITDRLALSPADRAEIDDRLRALRGAVDAGSLSGAGTHAAGLANRLRALTAPSPHHAVSASPGAGSSSGS